MACSSSVLSSRVGRFMCLSWSNARSFIFCRILVISYWIWKLRKTIINVLFWKTSNRTPAFPVIQQLHLINSFYPFGRQLLCDADSSFWIQTDPRDQSHSVIGQLRKNTELYEDVSYDNRAVRWFSKQLYLIKLLMWLSGRRAERFHPVKRSKRRERGRLNDLKPRRKTADTKFRNWRAWSVLATSIRSQHVIRNPEHL